MGKPIAYSRLNSYNMPTTLLRLYAFETRALLRLERTMNLFGGRGGRGRGGEAPSQ